ncbi:unnamed protein product [Thlaspi arvense]|uniref:Reverse transcriptase zinc-binding domain-containing protein n=1 Tax=Thlaspi arvense TaxID=13288 RepID=A0AAU9R7Y9_THLAR|nr:unnamed protein product [Thlaspi arvense]
MGPPSSENKDFVVKDLLLSNSSSWNLATIRLHLPQYEKRILKIKPSDFRMADELSWLPVKSGVYSTKSGYVIAKLHAVTAPAPPFRWLQCVWRVKTSPKLKTFLWKIKNRALPVEETLATQGIIVDPTCKRCGAAENELHFLLQCPFAVRVRDRLPVTHKPSATDPTTIPQLLQDCCRMINLPPTGMASTPLYPWVFWNLWTCRNQLLFEGKDYTSKEVADKACSDAKAWHVAQEALTQQKREVKLTKPCPSTISPASLTCFVDAAWDNSTGCSGLGWVLKDNSNTTLFQNSRIQRFVSSALVAEALALKAALQDAASSGIKELNCHSDSKNLISLINGNGNSVDLQGILHDIRVESSSSPG